MNIKHTLVSTLGMFILSVSVAVAQSEQVQVAVYPAESRYFVVNDNPSYTKYKSFVNKSDIMLEVVSAQSTPITQMRFSNTGAWDTTPWEQFSRIKRWQLAQGDGNKPVYAQFQLTDGTIIDASVSLFLDTTPPVYELTMLSKTIGPNSQPDVIVQVSGQDYGMFENTQYRFEYETNFESSPWRELNTNQLTLPFNRWTGNRTALEKEDGEKVQVLFQARDGVGNVASVQSAEFVLDTIAPLVYAKAVPSESLASKIMLRVFDTQSNPVDIFISSDQDPYDVVQGRATRKTFESPISWKFASNRMAYLGITDEAGNYSEVTPVMLSYPEVSPTGFIDPTGVQINPSVSPGWEPDSDYQDFQNRITELEGRQASQAAQTEVVQKAVAEFDEELSVQKSIIQQILTFLSKLWPW